MLYDLGVGGTKFPRVLRLLGGVGMCHCSVINPHFAGQAVVGRRHRGVKLFVQCWAVVQKPGAFESRSSPLLVKQDCGADPVQLQQFLRVRKPPKKAAVRIFNYAILSETLRSEN